MTYRVLSSDAESFDLENPNQCGGVQEIDIFAGRIALRISWFPYSRTPDTSTAYQIGVECFSSAELEPFDDLVPFNAAISEQWRHLLVAPVTLVQVMCFDLVPYAVRLGSGARDLAIAIGYTRADGYDIGDGDELIIVTSAEVHGPRWTVAS